jgi:hypothetical protein
MRDIDLGSLEHGPHANLIRDMASKCSAEGSIQAIWVGGSLAAGLGDAYSDIDFRIAVEPGQIDRWISPDWEQYLPIRPSGGLLMRFGEQALLHHLVLADGTIVDFYVQDTTQQNPEPKLVILACRNAEFREKLEGFARPAAVLVREIDGAVVRQFLVDYWITTHKEMKALARKYDHFSFAGLYLERMALLRAWYMQAVGKDIDSRVTLHMLGALHKGLDLPRLGLSGCRLRAAFGSQVRNRLRGGWAGPAGRAGESERAESEDNTRRGSVAEHCDVRLWGDACRRF